MIWGYHYFWKPPINDLIVVKVDAGYIRNPQDDFQSLWFFKFGGQIIEGWYPHMILLMAEIRRENHLGWCWNPINNGKNYLSTGAGFQPSTVGIVFDSFMVTKKLLPEPAEILFVRKAIFRICNIQHFFVPNFETHFNTDSIDSKY